MHWLIACRDGETASVEAEDLEDAVISSGFEVADIVAALASDY